MRTTALTQSASYWRARVFWSHFRDFQNRFALLNDRYLAGRQTCSVWCAIAILRDALGVTFVVHQREP